jgi:hypothetical protein
MYKVGRTHGRGSARRKAPTYTQDNTNTEWTQKGIHASSGIWTHDSSVRAGEESLCLRPRGHRDQQSNKYAFQNSKWTPPKYKSRALVLQQPAQLDAV